MASFTHGNCFRSQLHFFKQYFLNVLQMPKSTQDNQEAHWTNMLLFSFVFHCRIPFSNFWIQSTQNLYSKAKKLTPVRLGKDMQITYIQDLNVLIKEEKKKRSEEKHAPKNSNNPNSCSKQNIKNTDVMHFVAVICLRRKSAVAINPKNNLSWISIWPLNFKSNFHWP